MLRMLSSLYFFSIFVVLVNAHFRTQFPPPRGPFVEKDEPKFCDGYTTPNENRTQVSLKSSYISLESEHPSWTVALFVSNSSDPKTFQDFEQVTPFMQNSGEGTFCMPLDLSASNGTFTEGRNVTFQILFSGGDGNLFQCADVTLTNSTTNAIPSGCNTASLQASAGNTGSGSSPAASNGAAMTCTFPIIAFITVLAGVFLTMV
ncbi:expression library immunization antigen 1 [Moniliophthora roreri MCA 2997]|uniref:Expression library immunization antigen 1 n=1 Tax=Moniliophthora roreri (strain MCA 2997) TaxID=1381753 RepID=V2Y0Z7_MONRO|nr:expression library immunization antigen 1 [Moniliophthora roreri MCA 2997]